MEWSSSAGWKKNAMLLADAGMRSMGISGDFSGKQVHSEDLSRSATPYDGPSEPSGSETHLEGWLLKKGEKGIKGVKAWKSRYFMRREKKLFYYACPRGLDASEAELAVAVSGIAKGFIDLLQLQTFECTTYEGREGYGFRVSCKTGRVYRLMAHTEESRRYWMEGLKAIQAELLPFGARISLAQQEHQRSRSLPSSSVADFIDPEESTGESEAESKEPLVTTHTPTQCPPMAVENAARPYLATAQSLPSPKKPPPQVPLKIRGSPRRVHARGRGSRRPGKALPPLPQDPPPQNNHSRNPPLVVKTKRAFSPPIDPLPSRRLTRSSSIGDGLTSSADSLTNVHRSFARSRALSRSSDGVRVDAPPRRAPLGAMGNAMGDTLSRATTLRSADTPRPLAGGGDDGVDLQPSSSTSTPSSSIPSSPSSSSKEVRRRAALGLEQVVSLSSASNTLRATSISSEAEGHVHLLGGEKVCWNCKARTHHNGLGGITRHSGTLCVTNFAIVFEPDATHMAQCHAKIPLCSILSMEVREHGPRKAAGDKVLKTKSSKKDVLSGKKAIAMMRSSMATAGHRQGGAASGTTEAYVDVVAQDLRVLRIEFNGLNGTREHFLRAVETYSPASANALFAFTFAESVMVASGSVEAANASKKSSWAAPRGVENVAFVSEVEYFRLGLPNERWALSELNEDFSFSPTYPSLLLVPADLPLAVVCAARDFRTKARLPVVCWKHPGSEAVMLRSSQPKVGMTMSRDENDELYFAQIVKANPSAAKGLLHVLDCRPRANAVANTAKGAGYELEAAYKCMKLTFLGIENIHAMRDAYKKMIVACNQFEDGDEGFWTHTVSEWWGHIRAVLKGAVLAAQAMEEEKASVLVHCSDGWDRTPQVCAISQLMMDEYYRTWEGFQVLIEKEWISFGHRFAARCGHYVCGKRNKESPIFHQFLECVYMLMEMYPSSFEFSQKLLIRLSDESHRAQYGTFLCDNEKERRIGQVRRYTISLWNVCNEEKHSMVNPRYAPHKGILPQYQRCADVRRFTLWKQFYYRYNPLLNPM